MLSWGCGMGKDRTFPTRSFRIVDKAAAMAIMVSLREMVDEMQTISSEIHVYLNKVTGKFVTILENELSLSEMEEDLSDYPEWQQEGIKEAQEVWSSDDYLEIPDQFEIHEYSIMESFCYSIVYPKIRDTLLRNIHGSGAFRRFKDTIYRYGIEDGWFHFKDQAYKEIAIGWLESHGMAYKDDLTSDKQIR